MAESEKAFRLVLNVWSEESQELEWLIENLRSAGWRIQPDVIFKTDEQGNDVPVKEW